MIQNALFKDSKNVAIKAGMIAAKFASFKIAYRKAGSRKPPVMFHIAARGWETGVRAS